MKKYNLDATDGNVLNTIKLDLLQRSQDVKDFLYMVDTIDYNAFISVDQLGGMERLFYSTS